MSIVGRIKKGAYFDSVTLMRVGRDLGALPGVVDAALVMGTKANKSILQASGLLSPELAKADETDLLLAVKGADAAKAQAALNAAEAMLKQAVRKAPAGAVAAAPVSLEGAQQLLPDANLALISVAGRYAGLVAEEALERGLHVMLFSDNVALEDEIRLKQLAHRKGLLVMGPDCGTAIINGVPLAFANVVPRGEIGIVAAAGTGLQEVSTLIANQGGGISQAIGTGGRDVKKEVGGIMFMDAIRALAADPDTRVILLVSKPPHPDVQAAIMRLIRKAGKPVVSLFLGAPAAPGEPTTLEEAALTALARARGENPDNLRKRLAEREVEIRTRARNEAAQIRKGRKYLRGLFSGGTFCAEAQVILEKLISEVSSNAPTGATLKLKDSLKSVRHTVIDLGEDEFTVGRPHPMIDFSLRNRRILAEARHPETAVILLDVVLGYGAHPDPAGELEPVVREARRHLPVICSITGTDADPQHRHRVEQVLRQAGALVMPSNAAACMLAGYIVRFLGE